MAALLAFFYDLIYVLPLCLLAFGIGGPFLDLPEKSTLPLYLAVILPAVLCSIRHVDKKYRFLFPGVLLVSAVFRVLAVPSVDRLAYLESQSFVLWIFLIALAGYGLGRLIAGYTAAKRILLFFLAAGGIAVMVTETEIGKAPAAFGLMLVLFLVAEEVQRYWKKSGYSEPKVHLVSIAPFLLLLSLLVYKIPAPQNPYDWSFAVSIWQRASDFFSQLSYKIIFHTEEYNTIGFTGTGTMHGKQHKTEEEVMLFTDNGRTPEIVYLTGTVLDHFDGRKWTAENELEDSVRALDTFEFMCAVNKKDPRYSIDYYQNSNATLQSLFHNTHYLFMPQKTFLTEKTLGEMAFSETWDSVTTKKIIPYKAEYKVSSLWLNQGTPLFRELLLLAEPITEEDWGKLLSSKRLTAENELSYAHYTEYVGKTKEIYTKAPVLSGEVEELLEQLFAGAGTDLERLERLEAWLHSMNYNRAAEKLPEQVNSPEEFLDYFLLGSQEGYCVHYATTFTLVARALGFPVRYVQGFYFARKGADHVMVRSEMAHAWPEVYFENVGWIRFEPTPGFEKSEGWALRARENSGSGTGSGTPYVPFEVIPTPEQTPTRPSKAPEEKKPFDYRTVSFPAACSVAFLLCYLLIVRIVNAYRYRRMDLAGKALFLCRKNRKMLRRLGYKQGANETFEEYRQRLDSQFVHTIPEFLSVYEQLVYSEGEITEEMLKMVEASHKELAGQVRKKRLMYRFTK